MAGVRRFILFILGAVCLIGAITEDPIHVTSLVVGLLLMGVITWEQIAVSFGRDGHPERNAAAAEKPPGY